MQFLIEYTIFIFKYTTTIICTQKYNLHYVHYVVNPIRMEFTLISIVSRSYANRKSKSTFYQKRNLLVR